MNIFYLDKDPVQAATMMCDKHVVKNTWYHIGVSYRNGLYTHHREL